MVSVVRIIILISNSFETHYPQLTDFLQNHWEGCSCFVQLGPQLEPLDDIGRVMASSRFEQRGKLEQLGIEI